MSKKANRPSAKETPPNDYVSVWYWMFAQLLLILPIVNLVAVPVLAFVGENRTRKNFFRALLVWLALTFGLHLAVFFAVASPAVFQWLKDIWTLLIDLIPVKK